MDFKPITGMLFEGSGPNCPKREDLEDMKPFALSASCGAGQDEYGRECQEVVLVMQNCDEVDSFFSGLFVDSHVVQMKVDGMVSGFNTGAVFVRSEIQDGENHLFFRALETPDIFLANVGEVFDMDFFDE